MSNVLKENYKKLVDALAPYFGGASDFDDLTNRPQESDTIDISDLDLPMPAKPTDYPILFDETGTEYQVGYYKRASDGKVKPVWRKMITFNSILEVSNSTWTDSGFNFVNNSLEKILKCEGGDNNSIASSNTIYSLMASAETNTSNNIRLLAARHNNPAYILWLIMEYTKTTDEWKEV